MKKFFQDKYLPIILGALSFIGGIFGLQNSSLINANFNVNFNEPPQQKIIETSNSFLAGKKLDEGLALYNQGKYQAAIELYNEAIKLDPNYAPAYNNRGMVYADLKRYLDAIADFNKSIELKNPTLHFAYNNRGMAYTNIQNYEQAISDYNRAIEINPNFEKAYNNRGVVYFYLKDYQKAISNYEKAIEINPNFAFPYNNRGNVYRELKNFDAAISNYNKAIEVNPNYMEAYYNRGLVYQILGETEKANADFATAKKLGYKN